MSELLKHRYTRRYLDQVARAVAASSPRFDAHVVAAAEVQQCYRVGSGPDFVLVVFVPDVAAYHAFAHRVLTAQANVRYVRSFFAVKRSKFEPTIPL